MGVLRVRVVAVVAVALVMSALVFLHAGGLNGPDYWRWGWQRRSDLALVFSCLLLAASPALAAQCIAERRRAVAVAMLCLSIIALQLTGNAIAPQARGAARMRKLAADQLSTSYYTVAESVVNAERNGHPVDWLRQYDDLLRLAPQHATTKPPGPVAFYIAVIRLFGSQNAPIAAAILMALLSAGAVAETYSAMRRIAGPAVGFQAATLLALAPSMTLLFLYLDTIYPILSCAMVGLWFAVLEEGNIRESVAFGLVLFATTMTSYTLLVIGIPLAGMTLTHLLRGGSLRRVTRLVGIALATPFCAYVVLWLSTGFNPISAFRTALEMQYRYLPLLHRPYPRTIPFDLLDFFLGAGWIPVMLAILWLATRLRKEALLVRSTALWCVVTPLIVALTGLIQAETARVWIFMLPLLLLPASLELSRWTLRERLTVHCMMVMVTIALYANMIFTGPS